MDIFRGPCLRCGTGRSIGMTMVQKPGLFDFRFRCGNPECEYVIVTLTLDEMFEVHKKSPDDHRRNLWKKYIEACKA